MIDTLPRVLPGERVIIAGRTGSGKTIGAVWLLSRSPGCWLVLDRKYDKAFENIGPTVGLNCDYDNLWKENRILIVRPETSDPGELDAWIQRVSERWQHIGLLIDELYYVHTNGRAGDGLVGWLTRGRSRQQSFIGCTQRPAWVSRFCFSESDYIVSYTLNLADDRKRMYEFTGRKDMLQKTRRYKWAWYDVARDKLTRFGKVPFSDLERRFGYLTEPEPKEEI